MILSICIPSYNRPEDLRRSLESIDSTKYAKEIEVIIQEDKAPRRLEVRETVEDFKINGNPNGYAIHYYENEENCGYDKNLRTLPKHAIGEYVMYMGDDDMYVSGSLDEYIDELKKETPDYILRRYRTIHKDGKVEEYRYSKGNVFLNRARIPMWNISAGACLSQDLLSEENPSMIMIVISLMGHYFSNSIYRRQSV